jgi:hypothetical protein
MKHPLRVAFIEVRKHQPLERRGFSPKLQLNRVTF